MLHFTRAEFDERLERTRAEMAARGLDALLVFSPESQYWLTGYDTFGFCFFQCLVVSREHLMLLTRAPDLRQAQLTSTIEDIRIWKDRAGADPTGDLVGVLGDMGLLGARIGWETTTQGLVHHHGAALARRLPGLVEASELVADLRLVKSAAELAYVRRAAALADAAWEAGLGEIRAGADEGRILAAMQGAVFEGGGDYAGNEFIIGSGDHALLCRYQAGRRVLDRDDQITLEWAGAYRHYHAALMKTVVVGSPRPEHAAMQEAAEAALLASEARLRPGATMGEVFAAHAETFDKAGLAAHRMNACGYSLGARFAPCWMDHAMFYEANPIEIRPDMVFFLHMILMDSETGTAMCLGRTSIVTEEGSKPISAMPLGLVTR